MSYNITAVYEGSSMFYGSVKTAGYKPVSAGTISVMACLPLAIILGVLMAAMYAAGRDPFAFMDISRFIRLPRVERAPIKGASIGAITYSDKRKSEKAIDRLEGLLKKETNSAKREILKNALDKMKNRHLTGRYGDVLQMAANAMYDYRHYRTTPPSKFEKAFAWAAQNITPFALLRAVGKVPQYVFGGKRVSLVQATLRRVGKPLGLAKEEAAEIEKPFKRREISLKGTVTPEMIVQKMGGTPGFPTTVLGFGGRLHSISSQIYMTAGRGLIFAQQAYEARGGDMMPPMDKARKEISNAEKEYSEGKISAEKFSNVLKKESERYASALLKGDVTQRIVNEITASEFIAPALAGALIVANRKSGPEKARDFEILTKDWNQILKGMKIDPGNVDASIARLRVYSSVSDALCFGRKMDDKVKELTDGKFSNLFEINIEIGGKRAADANKYISEITGGKFNSVDGFMNEVRSASKGSPMQKLQGYVDKVAEAKGEICLNENVSRITGGKVKTYSDLVRQLEGKPEMEADKFVESITSGKIKSLEKFNTAIKEGVEETKANATREAIQKITSSLGYEFNNLVSKCESETKPISSKIKDRTESIEELNENISKYEERLKTELPQREKSEIEKAISKTRDSIKEFQAEIKELNAQLEKKEKEFATRAVDEISRKYEKVYGKGFSEAVESYFDVYLSASGDDRKIIKEMNEYLKLKDYTILDAPARYAGMLDLADALNTRGEYYKTLKSLEELNWH
ncbi:MAG: hypothetical protein QW112_02290, partial [Candidatus Micrarchaeia archaeon]